MSTALAPGQAEVRGSRVSTLQGILLALTVVTGLLDAASYLGMGNVLVANMTGNVLFLGFAIGRVPGFAITGFLVALAAFLAGAAVGGRLHARLGARRRNWLTTALLLQSVLSCAAAATAVLAGAAGGGPRVAEIALLAVGLGIQNASVRALAVPDLTTTVLTMTLTGLAADSSLAGGDNPRLLRRVTSVLALGVGGLAGAVLVTQVSVAATLATICALQLAITMAVAGAGEDHLQ